jgi:hypothetical protein
MIDKLRRQGLHMSSEALAAPADGPSEDDYKAFYSVLASSARGRAFLAEHARRARHAETETLLAAIARIEATLAEQHAREPAPAGLASATAPGGTALAAIAAQAMAAAESNLPVMKVIKAGQMPPPARFAGDDFTAAEPVTAEPVADAASAAVAADAETAPEAAPHRPADMAAASNVIAHDVPAEHASPPGTPVADALAAILALSEDERLALFS